MQINWPSWIFSGFIATVALSAMLATSQGIGITRMNLPYLLGSIVTHDRDRARLYGLFAHFLNGWAFSILYVLIFQDLNTVSWWFGLLLGLAHALWVLTVGMMVLPTVHPRMAKERHGPTAARQLEPPGFMALNYGYQTPLSIFLAHSVFGAILGSLYHLR